jgi:hypothetical protein
MSDDNVRFLFIIAMILITYLFTIGFIHVWGRRLEKLIKDLKP